jgi:hypothetical protein
LHTACALKVWQSSPLPLEIDIGGVDETIEQQYAGPRVATIACRKNGRALSFARWSRSRPPKRAVAAVGVAVHPVVAAARRMGEITHEPKLLLFSRFKSTLKYRSLDELARRSGVSLPSAGIYGATVTTAI